MTNIGVEVVLPYITGLPRDVAVNTFHFDVPDLDVADATAIAAALEAFYNEVPTGGADTIASRLSAYIDRSTDVCEMRFYDDESTGPALVNNLWTLEGASSTSSLPFEVAVCASFAGVDVGVPAAQQRGRVYLGPLVIDVIDSLANQPARPDGDFMDDLNRAMVDLANADLGPSGSTWVVYSRTNGNGSQVQYGWVDNEFDTQRRRQTEATARLSWSNLV